MSNLDLFHYSWIYLRAGEISKITTYLIQICLRRFFETENNSDLHYFFYSIFVAPLPLLQGILNHNKHILNLPLRPYT